MYCRSPHREHSQLISGVSVPPVTGLRKCILSICKGHLTGLQGAANAAASDAMQIDTWTSDTAATPAPPMRHTPDHHLDELLDAEDAWTMTRYPAGHLITVQHLACSALSKGACCVHGLHACAHGKATLCASFSGFRVRLMYDFGAC